MNVVVTNQHTTRELQGFPVHVLANEAVELAVVPELGARIISLKDRRTGRDWLWHPHNQLRLFRNPPCAEFATSPLAGLDECLPTIAPCQWQGQPLPDHGEAWNLAWQVSADSDSSTSLTTSIQLAHSSLFFERTIELLGSEVRLIYHLTNLGATARPFVWSLHPLLRLQSGDELELPASTRQLLNGHDWINSLATANPAGGCSKIFAHPVREGWAAIVNPPQRERLRFEWNPAENPALGLWLTRGGWHGHHHFAIEPTNATDDSLAVAAARNQCGQLAGRGSASWQLSMHVGF
jgi:hypothetical protein